MFLERSNHSHSKKQLMHSIAADSSVAVDGLHKRYALEFADRLPPHLWVPDDARGYCRCCSKLFSTFNRKHHCRMVVLHNLCHFFGLLLYSVPSSLFIVFSKTWYKYTILVCSVETLSAIVVPRSACSWKRKNGNTHPCVCVYYVLTAES